MALPFGLGAGVSVGLYKLQNDNNIPFSSFVLFLGVAMAITAFPVLARILAELKLLRTRVGVITMSAGLLNDCVAWVLLALVVALLNSSGGLEALYVFLATVAYSLFLIVIVAPLYRKLAVYTNSFERGPSPLLMFVTLLIVLISAFITDIFGVHAIFGGFLAGVIVPHDHDLAIKITEKIEDIINIIFLPLYFTLSGLKTQIGLLDSGIVWGYVILVIFVACFGKIVGCAGAAKVTGMTTRESFTVGFLMSCKGLVELIVLNIGHDAGVLNDQIFVIMVVMALVTTFMTTPVVMWLYPEWYQKLTAERFMTQYDDTMSIQSKRDPSVVPGETYFSLVTMLNRIDSVPSMMALIRLMKQETVPPIQFNKNQLDIHALRLLELTQRASDVMKIQDSRETTRQDPVLNVVRTFASLIGIESLQTRLEFSSSSEFVHFVADYSESVFADMILLPWFTQQQQQQQQQKIVEDMSPLEPMDNDLYQLSDTDFATSAYTITHCTIGLFIDRGFGHIQDGNPQQQASFHIIVPFYGGPDDRAALLFALRLQVYRQGQVLVLRYGNGTPTYASLASIQTTLNTIQAQSNSDEELLNTLFTSSDTSNVILQSVKRQTSEFATVLDGLSDPLDKHDLVVLGRSITSNYDALHLSTPTPHDGPYSKSFKAALGMTAHQILSTDTLASLVVVQAPILNQNA
ncbi:Sodium/hydrogen exchanger family-domain-containing protein [Gilbertella persicaria]|uniref:Sodium/hydrogen exchanger family-domain-containing protein n=1 Tax=Gilbertella persicaria TaxID=101096 RepID=UPI0022207CB7|nr:Sodium/hydrogen exchanger family-domain-containing protein [Gilbertella persicaria]KAI8091454.1 Sodium/hydrogen exchanger family-domain-containing protein [Gilbertella persicaria]